MLQSRWSALRRACSSVSVLVVVATGLAAGFPASHAAADTAPAWSRLAPPPAPDFRMYPATVYAPEFHEVIVFGGDTTHGVDNDVWAIDALDPNADWVEIHPAGPAPAPREATASVWDPVGHQMVVFGGLGRTDSLGNYAKYNDVWALRFQADGTAPAWVQLSAGTPGLPEYAGGNTPTARWNSMALFDSKRRRLVVIGGQSYLGHPGGYCFNGFSTGTLGTLSGRCGLPDSWAFDLAGTGGWTLLNPNGPRFVFNQAYYWPKADAVYVLMYQDPYDDWAGTRAGWHCYHMGLGPSAVNSVLPWLDCPAGGLNGGGDFPEPPGAPVGSAFGYSPSSDSIVLAATDKDSDPPSVSVYSWNQDQMQWTRYGGQSPDAIDLTSRQSSVTGAMVYDDSGHEGLALVGVTGGDFTERGTGGSSQLYVYDTGAGSWRTSRPEPRLLPTFQASPALDEEKDQLYVIGGAVAGRIDRTPEALWRADLRSGTWQALQPGGEIPPPNENGFYRSLGVFDSVGRRLLAIPPCGTPAGDDPSLVPQVLALDVDAQTPAWSVLPTTEETPNVCQPNVVFDPNRDRVLLFGGYVFENPFDSYVEWNRNVYSLDLSGGTATWRTLATVGIQRGFAIEDTGAAYDPAGDRVLFLTYIDGGSDPHDDAEWEPLVQQLSFADGAEGTWSTIKGMGQAPTARTAAVVAIDQADNQLVVWGGYDGPISTGSGADPTVYTLSLGATPTWGEMPTSGDAPRGRVLAAGAYDPVGQRLVVVGGCYGNCWDYDDHQQMVLSRDIYGIPLVPGSTPASGPLGPASADPLMPRPASQAVHLVSEAPSHPTSPMQIGTSLATCAAEQSRSAKPNLAACLATPAAPATEGATPAAPEAASPNCAVGGFDDRCESWTSTYDFARGHENGGYGLDIPIAQSVSPTGDRVFVTGDSWDDATLSYDSATVAFDLATHRQLWSTRFDGGSFRDEPTAIGVSPDGSKVFVLGISRHGRTDPDYVTFAYDAATGQQLWARTYDGPGASRTGSVDIPSGLQVSPDGSTVYVTGSAQLPTHFEKVVDQIGIGTFTHWDIGVDWNYETIAYGASDGHTLWEASMPGQSNPYVSKDYALAMSVSGDGSKVFVTGTTEASKKYGSAYLDYDTLTAAYDAHDGHQLWTSKFSSGIFDLPSAIGATSDGSRVFVGGMSQIPNSTDTSYRTIAYDGATGAQQWTATQRGAAAAYSGHGYNAITSLAVAPSGNRVYVTGWLSGQYESGSSFGPDLDFGTFAYSADTGQVAWSKIYSPSRWDLAYSVAASPDGQRVYVAGMSMRGESQGDGAGYDATTIAYGAADGGVAWTARYSRTIPNEYDWGRGVAVSPDSRSVLTMGFLANTDSTTNMSDCGVLAYDA